MDDTRALAARLRSASERSRPRADCPPAEKIWAALRLELPVEERLRIIDHTIECPTCAEAWRLAIELDREIAARGTLSARAGAALSRRSTWAWAAAAVLVLTVGAAVVLRQETRPPVRDTQPDVITSLLGENASLPRENFVLRWSAGPSGARYDIVVTTTNLDVIADVRGLERPEYRVPAERLAGLAPGTRVLWRVVAGGQDGSRTASVTFEVSVGH
jgi:hypothetical protein